VLLLLQLTTPLGEVFQFTAPAYINDKAKVPLLFGPTLRGRAGDRVTIKLSNLLVQEKDPNPEFYNKKYEGPMDTSE
jgi:FtsP/CotA-like multicopper oxidase with cupredoxin domain